MRYKRRRTFVILLIALTVAGLGFYKNESNLQPTSGSQIKNILSAPPDGSVKATEALERLVVKGRAPKAGYDRKMFMDGWRKENDCDKRNIILRRDMENVVYQDDCIVLSGVLNDPYTGHTINFKRGFGTSDDVQIDHVVPLSDAWQKGAQQLSYKKRNNLANDPLNLLAVDGPANQQKSDGDAATWMPPNKIYRCAYVARQVAVKLKYGLWATQSEKDAIKRILNNCPNQVLPVENA